MCAGASAQVGNVRTDFVVTDLEAHLLLPAQLVCEPIVSSISWSEDGSKLVALRHVVSPKRPSTGSSDMAVAGQDLLSIERTEIVFWDKRTSRSRVALKMAPAEGSLGPIEWAGPNHVTSVAQLTRRNARGEVTGTNAVLLISSEAPAKVLVETDAPIQTTSSPTGSGILVWEQAEMLRPSVARLFDLRGVQVTTVALPAGAFPIWGSSGRLFLIAKTVGRPQWSLVDPRNGSITVAQPEPPRERPVGAFRLVYSKSPILSTPSEPLAVTVASLTATRGKVVQNAVVAADVTGAEVSPGGHSVVFVTQGAGMVRPIAGVPLDLFAKARDAALRTEALSRAKQVGIAFLMYAADNDDALPGKQGWENRIEPYLKNRSLFENFTFTYEGGSLDQLAKPAETELGYVAGPGGRAVVYADGHAKWVPD